MHPTMSIGWCDCGATIGKTLIEGRWYWTHGGVVGAAVHHANGDPCPTCDVDEDAPNPACASWVHPGNGPAGSSDSSPTERREKMTSEEEK